MKKGKEPKAKINILENLDLLEALKYDRFHHFLFKTKKYRDLYWSKEALFSLTISLLVTWLFIVSAIYSIGESIKLASSIIPIFIGGMITILGLSLAGLAIVSSTLGDKFLTTLIIKGKLYSILSILFSFYFAGFIIGMSIVFLTFSYIILSFKVPFNLNLYIGLTFVNSYLVFFSIIYSVMLLGTCIRLVLIKYTVEKTIKNNN